MVWIKRKIIISYVVNQYPMVWTTRLLCEQATHGTNQFLFGVITQIVVWSHIFVETRWDSHPVGVITSPVGVSIPPDGVITTHVFPSTHVFPWWKLMFTSNEAWLFALLILWDFTIEKYFCEIKVFLRKRHRSGSATRLRCPRRGGRPISSLFMRRTSRDWTCITKVLDA